MIGAVFSRYGSVRGGTGLAAAIRIFAGGRAEVIDTKDLEALSKIVEVLARKWRAPGALAPATELGRHLN